MYRRLSVSRGAFDAAAWQRTRRARWAQQPRQQQLYACKRVDSAARVDASERGAFELRGEGGIRGSPAHRAPAARPPRGARDRVETGAGPPACTLVRPPAIRAMRDLSRGRRAWA